MDNQPIYLIIGGTLLLPALWWGAIRLETYMFKQKLYGLGHLVGRSKDEIILAVGVPNSFSTIDGDRDLLQWQRSGYHIALSFKNGICEGATHEFNAF
jgi:hypothetical protein